MRLYVRLLFLTLVLRAPALLAAPNSDSLQAPPKTSLHPNSRPPSTPNDSANEIEKSTLQWKSAPPLSPSEQALQREERKNQSSQEYDHSLRLGIIAGKFTEGTAQTSANFLAFRQDFNKQSFETWQGELKLGSGNLVQITVGKKFQFLLEPVTSPYYKFAAGNLLSSTEGIGSVFNFKKFQAIVAVGLDDLFLLSHRWQLEGAVSIAVIGVQAEVSLGFAF